MSQLILAADIERLAVRLAKGLDQSRREHDLFVPTQVVVPNRFLGRWLKLWLSRQQGVAANLRLRYLENALWDLLRAIDPRDHPEPPELLDDDAYRLLVLRVLQENREPELKAWASIVQPDQTPSRRTSRRTWRLADEVGGLIRDYEYHRQYELIQPWLRGDFGLDAEHVEREAPQRAVFRAIVDPDQGLRHRLGQLLGKNLKTFPQYAMEVREWIDAGAAPRRVDDDTTHLFGITQASSLHWSTIGWLGRFFDLAVYHPNALCGRLTGKPTRSKLLTLASSFRGQAPASGIGSPLIEQWDRAGAESLAGVAELLADRESFLGDLLADSSREVPAESLALFADNATNTVLARLQDHLRLGQGETSPERLAQDRSLQIVACPGIEREVETVRQSILQNLATIPDLRQTDIAVFATDMEAYRPVLRSVFGRGPRELYVSLADFTAAGASAFGQALVGMLDLALESFTRTRVLDVVTNPCFLAKLGIDHAQALTWLQWAEELAIHQGWDQHDRIERGHPPSPQFGWRLGLQRLRLGRIMESTPLDPAGKTPHFGPVAPFADLDSGDRDRLSVFCLAIEGLLPRLAELRRFHGTGAEWAEQMRALSRDFLDVPEDRPEEDQIRAELLESWHVWELVNGLQSDTAWSLGLVREMAVSKLRSIAGVRGGVLAGGVTLAALQPLRAVPFRIVYIVGLGEAHFPGSNQLSGLDLRSQKTRAGDIKPADFNRYLLLETLLSAREKLYLSWNSYESRRDQELHFCSPLQELIEYLESRVLTSKLEITRAPLLASDPALLGQETDQPSSLTGSDVLAQFGTVDRMLGIEEAVRESRIALTPEETELIAARRSAKTPEFQPGNDIQMSLPTPTLRIVDLRRFLECPAEGALYRQLGGVDRMREEEADDEPFTSDPSETRVVFDEVLRNVVLTSMKPSASGLDVARAAWPETLAQVYQDRQRQGKTPEGDFGVVDRDVIEGKLVKRIEVDGLARYLSQRDPATFVGPILLGEHVAPIGARTRFPALEVLLSRRLPGRSWNHARLVGSQMFAWRTDEALEVLAFGRGCEGRKLSRDILEPVLFYLALKAGPGREWLGNRDLKLTVLDEKSRSKAMMSFHWTAEETPEREAREYLSNLITDCLDPNCFDLLPLATILSLDSKPYEVEEDEESAEAKEQYAADLEYQVMEDADSGGFGTYRAPPLVKLADPRTPADAYDKVVRRFRLLDRGPRKLRGERDRDDY